MNILKVFLEDFGIHSSPRTDQLCGSSVKIQCMNKWYLPGCLDAAFEDFTCSRYLCSSTISKRSSKLHKNIFSYSKYSVLFCSVLLLFNLF